MTQVRYYYDHKTSQTSSHSTLPLFLEYFSNIINNMHCSLSKSQTHNKINIVMKALQANSNSKDLFKKYQKPTETQEQIMNGIQAKIVAKEVGIDMVQIKNMQWFFELVSKIKLPKDYKRYLSDQRDYVIYVNQATHQETVEHPSLNLLKIMFYQTLANNKSVYTFLDKESKLLPFVQDKMLRQAIGLNSKRREAQKVNLQRDQNGRMMMSKLERIVPDIKALISSRSYVLKMIVQRVFTRKQVMGRGKRSSAYAATIAQVKKQMKHQQAQDDFQLENEDNLEQYQTIYQSAFYFYQQEFGHLDKIPARVLTSKQYIQSTPENVLKNLFLLNVEKENIQLYWLARMMDCMPLPPNWSKKRGTSFDSYMYEPQKLVFDIHPSYIYILKQMNKFKSIFKELGTIRQNYYYNMRQLTFFDFFQRSYTVDMYGYIQKNTKKQGKNKKEKKGIQKSEQVSDWMVLQGMKNSPITPSCYILLEHIQRYWSSLDFKAEPWCPSISPFGQVIWSSNINEKSMSFNPYKPKLSSLVNNAIKELPQITDDVLKKQYKSQQGQDEDDFLMLNTDLLQKQRQDFLDYYITHEDKAVPWPYQLKNRFDLIDQKIYYEQIFVSPFELDKGIVKEGEQVPFWLEKARAKNHTINHINLLLFNSDQYTTIKDQISDYALEMVGEHQPHLIDETEKRINRISTSEELIKFLNYINDLDMREQRKKQYLQSLKIESDSDIFGSEISQLEVNQDMDQESVKEQKEEQIEKSSSGKSSQKEPEVFSDSQEELIIKPVQIQIQPEPQPEPPREQYQFLQNFKKRRYLKSWQLQQKTPEELQSILLKQLGKKKRKCKYKQGLILKKIQKQYKQAKAILQLQYTPGLQSKRQKGLINAKRNMILTHLRKMMVPYGNGEQWFGQPKRKDISDRHSQMNYSQITNYDDFKSQISEYQTQQINKIIQDEKQRKRMQTKLKTQSSIHHQLEHQVTNDTIQLQPIYQIKPDITFDPVLKHIKKVSGDLNDFRKTFNHKAKSKVVQPQQMSQSKQFGRLSVISKSSSMKNIRNSEFNYQTAPAPQLKGNSLQKYKISIEPKMSLGKKQIGGTLERFPKFQTAKTFHRVCLDSTASHFLGKQAFLRKGDIVTMQARKALLSKGRGLQTYISKFY